MRKEIMVVGDVHGFWGALNHLLNKKRPKMVLQCGDFGWWPRHRTPARKADGMRISGFEPFGVKHSNSEIYFCPGNHEDWDELSLRHADFSQVMPNVWYAKQGAHFTLSDGRVVLFLGGAASIDKDSRTIGYDWFPQEQLPLSVLYKLEESGLKSADIVISHTCPQEFNPFLNKKRPYNGWEYKFYDSSQEVLSEVLYMYKPMLWYFGHFHVEMCGFHRETGTKWYALNDIPNSGWWRYLSDYGT